MPSGWADSNNRIMRRRGSLPIAANISAYRLTSSCFIFEGMVDGGPAIYLYNRRIIVKRQFGTPNWILSFYAPGTFAWATRACNVPQSCLPIGHRADGPAARR